MLMIKGPQILTRPVTIDWSIGYMWFCLLNFGAPAGAKYVQKGNSFQLSRESSVTARPVLEEVVFFIVISLSCFPV